MKGPVLRNVAAGLAGCLCWAASAPGETEAERLAAGFAGVKSLVCEMRRDKPLPDGGTLRMFSRVAWEAPDRLNSENASPLPRRTVSDGTVFRQYAEGMEKGFSRRVEDLDPEMRANLEMVPGSNANLLKPLLGAAEEELGEIEGLRCVGYALEHGYVVLGFDAEGRWARTDVYATAARDDRTLRSDYSDFEEIAPGAWLAKRQESVLSVGGQKATESVRISKVRANEPVPAAMFDGAAFFPGVEFTDDFGKMR